MYLKKIITILALAASPVLSHSQSGGITTGAALYCDSLNSGFISLTAFTGQILYWQSFSASEKKWKNIQNTTSTQSYTKLKQTTGFRAIVKNTTSIPDTSSISTITVYVAGNAGILNGGGHFCADAGVGTILLTKAPGNVLFWQYAYEGETSWRLLSSTSTTLHYTSVTRDTRYRAVVETVQGCPDDTTSSVLFSIQAKTIAGIISESDSVCYGASGDTLHLGGYAGKILKWSSSPDNGKSWIQIADTTSSLSYSNVTTTQWYKASVKNGICPEESTQPIAIALYNLNPASAGDDVTITRHEKITLQGKGNGDPQWSAPEYLSNALSFNPAADPMNTTNYVLTLKDQHGCITKDSVTVNVIVPIPTAITPNGDGVNDYFEIESVDMYKQNSLRIYNRWGIELFNASPYTNTWDGKSKQGQDLPDDIYYYIFDYGQGEKPVTNYILIKR